MSHKTELVIGPDIFDVHESARQVVIGHGVNTRAVMGAGMAAQVARRYPSVVPDYQSACHLGHLRPGRVWLVPVPDNSVIVANIASQRDLGAVARPDWLRQGLRDLHAVLDLMPGEFEVRLPLIGAGIGGLPPMQAADIIFECADESPGNVSTHLYLLPQGRDTDAVQSRHTWWYHTGA